MTQAANDKLPLLPATLSESELRTARLLFDAELSSGALSDASLRTPLVKEAVRVRAMSGGLTRLAQRVLFKLGYVDYWRTTSRSAIAARKLLLGDAAAAPPRFLIRVDEFPHARAWQDPYECGTASYARFHQILSEASVPYLVAVLPRVSRRPLDPNVDESRALDASEVAMLHRLGDDQVCFGLHGLDHRTRFASPRRRSELCGLDLGQTHNLLEKGMAELAALGICPDVFVPPYNRFDAAQLPLLASRFTVVCGGPESINLVGFQQTPQWCAQAVYLPSYPPFYAKAAEMLSAVRGAIEQGTGLWVPVVLHWEWEARDGWGALRQLAEVIAPYAVAWEEFFAAVRRSEGREPMRDRSSQEHHRASETEVSPPTKDL